jgi:hypothetical protein
MFDAEGLAEGEELGSNILSQNFARFRTSSPCMIGQSNMQRAPSRHRAGQPCTKASGSGGWLCSGTVWRTRGWHHFGCGGEWSQSLLR